MKYFHKFDLAIKWVGEKLLEKSYIVRTEKWQGIPLDHDMRETLNTSFHVFMAETIDELQEQIKPNLPWADIHFQERVSKLPMNPGKSYKIWPYYKMDKEMRNVDEKFSHTYMERIWPKYGRATNPKDPDPYFDKKLTGIRYEYGDFDDLINLLYKEPFTRQAFLPIFFPEDTGAVHGGRIPCTIGYHFIRRDNRLHVIYFIRSCDYLRHFRDDIYLAVLKVLWLIDQLQRKGNGDLTGWENVKPGTFTMHITSLHCFVSDEYTLKKSLK